MGKKNTLTFRRQRLHAYAAPSYYLLKNFGKNKNRFLIKGNIRIIMFFYSFGVLKQIVAR